MRMLFLAQGYPCASAPTAGIFHRQQMRLVAQAGIDATLIVPMPWVPSVLAARNPRWDWYRAQPDTQTDGALTIYRPRYFAIPGENRHGLPWLAQLLAVRRLLRRVGYRRPDAIHAFFGLPTGAVGRALAQKWGLRYTVSLHGDDVTRHPYFHRLNRTLLRNTCRDAAFVCATSPPLAVEARELTGADVASLSIGIDFDVWAATGERAAARAELGLPATDFVLLFAGSVIEAKGIGDLKTALARHPIPGLTLVAVGDGPLRGSLTRETGAICPGAKTQDVLRRYMTAADAIILPSHHEGLGMVLVEGCAMGLAAAGSDTGGIGDLLKDGRGYLFPPHDPEALSRALREMIANPTERERRRQRLDAYARAHHDIVTNTNRLISVWRALGAS